MYACFVCRIGKICEMGFLLYDSLFVWFRFDYWKLGIESSVFCQVIFIWLIEGGEIWVGCGSCEGYREFDLVIMISAILY